MSIILKGIDTPKKGEWLEVIIKPTKEVIVDTIRYKDNALLKTEYGLTVQIPKDHGRLIDMDDSIIFHGLNKENFEEYKRRIFEVHGILEAEEEE